MGALMSASHSLDPSGNGTAFFFYDLDSEERFQIRMPLEFPHVAVGHPIKRELVFIPESGGSRACVLDLGKRKVVKEIIAPGGRLFGGHATFRPDGSRFYSSEFAPLPSGEGFVSEWDGENFTFIRSFPSRGRFPHDVVLAKDGLNLTAANLGAETGAQVKASGIHVCRLELKTGKLLERVELNDQPGGINSHPSMQGSGSVALEDEVMRTDAAYFLSYMQTAVPEFRIFAYAHSHRKAVTVWNVAERRLIRELTFPEQPRALTRLYNKTHIAVAMESGKLAFINTANYELDPRLEAKLLLPVTTHVNAWWNYQGQRPVHPPDSAGGYSY